MLKSGPLEVLPVARGWGARPCLEAAMRADQLLEDGDLAGAARILDAIERLQATAPAEGEPIH